jgi:thiamine biosynthesis protein ThiC
MLMTQMIEARAGRVTVQMQKVAEKEKRNWN